MRRGVRWESEYIILPPPPTPIVHSNSKSNMASRINDRGLMVLARPNKKPSLQATYKAAFPSWVLGAKNYTEDWERSNRKSRDTQPPILSQSITFQTLRQDHANETPLKNYANMLKLDTVAKEIAFIILLSFKKFVFLTTASDVCHSPSFSLVFPDREPRLFYDFKIWHKITREKENSLCRFKQHSFIQDYNVRKHPVFK